MSEKGQKPLATPVCNLEYLLVNLKRNRVAAERLVNLFLENQPLLVARMEGALSSGDLLALKDVVHDIRSNCVLFSAQRAVDLARDIEFALHESARTQGVVIDWSGKVAALRGALNDMAHELGEYHKKQQP